MIDRSCRSEPVSSTQVTTIWNTTRPREMSDTLRLVLPRPASRKTSTAFARDDITAGNRPENTAAASVASTVKSSAGPSTSKVIHDGGGFSRFRTVADSQSVDA